MRFLGKYPSSLIAILSLLSFSIAMSAQEVSPPSKVDAQTRMIKLNVLVTDSSNRPVTDLRAEDFRVTEDGKQQAIEYFSREELPVSYGIVVDASGSMRTLLDHILNAGKGVVASNKQGDEAFVMRFTDADSIQIEQGFTSNKLALEEALDNIFVEGGLTAVMDAINRSIDFLKKYKRSEEGAHRHQAIVLITDGEDRGSRARNMEALLSRLREEGVQFFIIGLTKMSNVQGSRERAAGFLTRVAEVSGGRAFFPASPAEIPGVVSEIARDLRTQYVIGYTPTNVIPDGAFRKVQVTVAESPGRKKLNVITRPGYVAPRL
ncbi:MAG TPA: VWA domain-containing protein [Pyrinomonadaceae bacterium]